jgi:riboflavin kinase
MSKKEPKLNYHDYAEWFALINLAHILTEKREIQVKSTEFCKTLGTSQQTASRRLQNLERKGWIIRKKTYNIQEIEITDKGYQVIFRIYEKIKDIYERFHIIGKLITGANEGRYYISIKGYYEQFKEILGYEPFKGTLNLELTNHHFEIFKQKLNSIKPIIIKGFTEANRGFGSVLCYPALVYKLHYPDKKCEGAVLQIERTFHKKHVVEIIAKPFLREVLNIKDGDKVVVSLNNER